MKMEKPLGTVLKGLRVRESITQQQLADRVGVSQQCIHKWEREKSMPSAETLSRLAGHFGVTLDYLMGRSDTPDFEYHLRDDEATLIDNYRAIGKEKQKSLLDFAKFLLHSADTNIGNNVDVQNQTSKSIMTVDGDNAHNTINGGGRT